MYSWKLPDCLGLKFHARLLDKKLGVNVMILKIVSPKMEENIGDFDILSFN
jgi:hypothetical protein